MSRVLREGEKCVTCFLASLLVGLQQSVGLVHQVHQHPGNASTLKLLNLSLPGLLGCCKVRPLLRLQLGHFSHSSVREQDGEGPTRPWRTLKRSLPEEVGSLIRGGHKLYTATATNIQHKTKRVFTSVFGPVLVRLPLVVLHKLGDHHNHGHLKRYPRRCPKLLTSSWMTICQK